MLTLLERNSSLSCICLLFMDLTDDSYLASPQGLTLRGGLNLFFEILPISTLVPPLLRIFWPPQNSAIPFHHGVQLLPTCLLGLEGLIQIPSSFDCK